MNSKRVRNKTNSTNEIPETDFSNGVRDKYASGLKKNGYTIRVYRSDGSFKEKQVPSESLVSLDPDIQAYFPDSTAVNRALRKVNLDPTIEAQARPQYASIRLAIQSRI